MKLKNILLTALLLFLLVAVMAIPVSAQQAEEFMSTDSVVLNTAAKEHPYEEIILQVMSVAEPSGSGYGGLYDVDGNGTQELLVLYPDCDRTGKVFAAYGVYTVSGSRAVPLLEGMGMVSLEFSTVGAVYVLNQEGRNYVAIVEDSIGMGFLGTLYLYEIDGTSAKLNTSVEYVIYESGGGYAIMNGVKCSVDDYAMWFNSFDRVMEMSIPLYDEEYLVGTVPLKELLVQVQSLPTQNYNGLTLVDGIWGYYIDGELQIAYTGLVEYNGSWLYVENGTVNWDYIGMTFFNGVWFYVEDGVVNWDYVGLTQYGGYWFYIENGMVNWYYVGMTQFGGYWFYVAGGMVDWAYNSLTQYGGYWFYISGGMVDWDYVGLVPFNGALFYVQNGMVNWSYSGPATYNGTDYNVQNGIVVW